jgi:hypothetical protein
MTYELAKELKEAGFPYREGVAHQGLHPIGKHPIAEFEANTVLVPTLYELIEACGFDFRDLSLHSPRSEVVPVVEQNFRVDRWSVCLG